MDYDAFMDLHELLKPGINEYISNNNNQINYRTMHDLPTFLRTQWQNKIGNPFGGGHKVLFWRLLFGYNNFP